MRPCKDRVETMQENFPTGLHGVVSIVIETTHCNAVSSLETVHGD